MTHEDNVRATAAAPQPSCRELLEEWLMAPTTDEKAWMKMTCVEISQSVFDMLNRTISPSSVAIHLPALVADLEDRSIQDVLDIRKDVSSLMKRRGAPVNPKMLEQLKEKLENNVPPKVCAHECGLSYNTVLKYQKIFANEQMAHATEVS